ncbi:MAG: GAF domain-containing protein, partial [Dehalococcoidia bacterium]|nr:GAF domain-containing protein [Dehalococcoidia bacterium]
MFYTVHRVFSTDYIGEMCLAPGEGIPGQVAQSGKATVVKDISRDERAVRQNLVAIEGLHAFASIPLHANDRVLGVLNEVHRII